MRWIEFLDTADQLSQGSSEGAWRSAVSRAYHAVFHYFREFFLTNGLDLGRGGQSHFNLYSGLLNCGIVAVSRFGTRVDDLRDGRIWADYDLMKLLTRANAVAHTQRARKLVADFQLVLQGIPPAQVVAGARQHLQAIGKLGKTP